MKDEEVIKHTFKKFTTELDVKKVSAQMKSAEPTREDLLEKYHQLLKEKRDLRKRNAQAQTNICQYLRKHNIDLFSQESLIIREIPGTFH